MTSLLQDARTIEIKGATYTAEPIDPGFAGIAAVRVTKLVNGESYDVVLQADGLVVCDCPDFVCRHEGKGTQCKHGKAMVAAGLLLAPVSGGSPAVATPAAIVAPITPADLKRAAMWGLKLPAAPLAVEAPASAPISGNSSHNGLAHIEVATSTVPEFVPEPSAPVAKVEAPAIQTVPSGWDAIEPEGDEEGPAWTWGAWTDADTWELGPEAARSELDFAAFASKTLVVEPAPASKPADRVWMGETVALLMTTSAIEDGDENAFYCLDVEHRDDFFHFLISLACPVATWSSWINLCRTGSPVSFPEPALAPEPRAAVRRKFAPSVIDEAWHAGFELGQAGENPVGPRGWSAGRLAAFYAGVEAGQARLHEETLEYHAWLDDVAAEAFGSPEDRCHEAELAEARSYAGHPAYEV